MPNCLLFYSDCFACDALTNHDKNLLTSTKLFLRLYFFLMDDYDKEKWII